MRSTPLALQPTPPPATRPAAAARVRRRGAPADDARLYDAVAEHVAALIARGALRPGEKLPSVRKLARQQKVSVSTVLHAYRLLEDRGLIAARPQSGHYVRDARRTHTPLPEPSIARAPASATRVSVADLVARVYGASRDPHMVLLGAAHMSPELLPTERLNRTLSAVARTAGGVGVSYDPPPGCLALRRQIARRAVDWGVALAPDDVVTTIGTMEAVHLCLRAVARAGDTIAIESPAYFGLLQLIESLEMRALEIPAHPRTGMDLDALEAALARHKIAAVLAMPNFSNPLGALMPDAHKRRLVAMLAAREVPLIEDDIYGDLHFASGQRPRPARAFDRAGLVMLCGSFSKTLAAGYRVGWAVPGPRYRERVERLKFAQTVANPTLTQLAVADFLERGGYDHHLRQLRQRLGAQVARFTEAVAAHFPPGTRVSRPAGGFVLWVELPAGTSALELHARALACGISVAPGPIFSAKQRFDNCVRISCGFPWTDTMERAVVTLGRLAALR